jgi:hypothetical protein
MTINSLKELKNLLQLCRRQGVQVMKVDGMEFALGELPKKYPKARPQPKPEIDLNAFPEADLRIPAFNPPPTMPDQVDTPDELTDEQMLFYSAEGH